MEDPLQGGGDGEGAGAATEQGRDGPSPNTRAPAVGGPAARPGARVGIAGLAGSEPEEPCIMVIFGASGDLTHRELLPSLFELAARDLLPDPFAVVGFARSDWSDGEFRQRMRAAVERECDFSEEPWRAVEDRLHYVRGDFTAEPGQDYSRLGRRIREIRESHGIPDRVFFHLAAPPTFFETIVQRLDAAGLARPEREDAAGGSEGSTREPGWRRLVVEKPFGEDRSSAAQLDRALRRAFPEDCIYRIDHFLGKETVQNMLVFRFANPNFEPIWNRQYIDHVQITAAEELGVGGRGSFYDATGVVRDMVQNHLLQLLCATALEPPVRYDGAALRDETLKVLRSVKPPEPDRNCVRGQYRAGTVEGEPVPGYREEEDVPEDSDTATFAALELHLDSWRWAGVPFYLRTGKRMARKLTEVAIRFRATPHHMFGASSGSDGSEEQPCSHLVFRLQPEEGISHTFLAKRPGPELSLEPVTMNFSYADTFGLNSLPRAYAWLIHDVLRGDQTLFARSDWIQEAWSIVDPLVDHWETSSEQVPGYEAGSWGPEAAHELVARSGRCWRQP